MAEHSQNAPEYVRARESVGQVLVELSPRLPQATLADALDFLEVERRREGLPVIEGRAVYEMVERWILEAPPEVLSGFSEQLSTALAGLFGEDAPADSDVSLHEHDTAHGGESAAGVSAAAAGRRAGEYATEWYLRFLTTGHVGRTTLLIEACAGSLAEAGAADAAQRAVDLAGAYHSISDALPRSDPPDAGTDPAGSQTIEYLAWLLASPPAVSEFAYLRHPSVRRLVDELASVSLDASLEDVVEHAERYQSTVAELRWLSGLALFVSHAAEREMRKTMAVAGARVGQRRRAVSRAAVQRLRDTAEAALASVEDYAAGNQPRAGDAYRWTILPVLSNPMTDASLNGPDESADDRAASLVRGYTTEVLERATERTLAVYPEASIVQVDAPIGLSGRLVRLNAAEPVQTERVVNRFYEELVGAAQGVDALPPEMRRRVADGHTQTYAWAHSHGFHLVRSDHVDSPGAFVAEMSTPWFELAEVAEVAVEEAALLFRGFSALEWALGATLERAAAPRDDRLLQAQLGLSRELSSDVVAGRVLPAVAVEVLTALWRADGPVSAVERLRAGLSPVSEAP